MVAFGGRSITPTPSPSSPTCSTGAPRQLKYIGLQGVIPKHVFQTVARLLYIQYQETNPRLGLTEYLSLQAKAFKPKVYRYCATRQIQSETVILSYLIIMDACTCRARQVLQERLGDCVQATEVAIRYELLFRDEGSSNRIDNSSLHMLALCGGHFLVQYYKDYSYFDQENPLCRHQRLDLLGPDTSCINISFRRT